ncbi:phage tail protein [Chitinophaga sp. 30R24]|uniref:phage tail protein n=1 Tax=Chitinophaga sp. 30R24 TaxID=3248838 RepID=UPI003B8FB084
MSTPFLGEIVMVSFNFAPRGYSMCNGALLPINQNQVLFSLLGTTYGGNGTVNFALPDMRGRVLMHQNGTYPMGAVTGEANHTLTVAEMPAHTHQITGTLQLPTGGTANDNSPANAYPAPGTTARFSARADDQMAPVSGATLPSDPANGPFVTAPNMPAGTPFNNMMPYRALNFIIALQGVFPSRN